MPHPISIGTITAFRFSYTMKARVRVVLLSTISACEKAGKWEHEEVLVKIFLHPKIGNSIVLLIGPNNIHNTTHSTSGALFLNVLTFFYVKNYLY